ncbi:hypothetical protein, partial [Selenihalanaerobacter shriftii]
NLNEARVQTDGYGLKNHFYQLVNLNEGENVNITVKYDRSNTGPSITRTNNQNTDTIASQQPVSNESNSNNSMLLILAIIIIGIMGYFIYNMINDDSTSTKNKHRNKKKNNKKLSPREEKKKARNLLLEGKISEKTYQDIIDDIED